MYVVFLLMRSDKINVIPRIPFKMVFLILFYGFHFFAKVPRIRQILAISSLF